MPRDAAQQSHSDAVKNVNRLTLIFAQAVARHQDDKSDNLIVSPYNALTCFAMVAKGADKNTREEMARALFGVSAQELDDAVTALAGLNAAMLAANKGQVELTTANGVWTNKELLTLNKPFADDLKNIFGAEVSEEAFSNPAVVEKINEWAAKNTNNLITKIIEQLGRDDFAVLASALYFKGQWTHKFDKTQTEGRVFTQDGGNAVTTPTMKKFYEEGEVRYHDGLDHEAVALTYGEMNQKDKKSPTMRIILVRPKDANLSACDWMAQQDSNTEVWTQPGAFKKVQGTVELPRMDIKQRHDLVPTLKDMGIRDAFTDGAADFSPMTAAGSKNLVIGKVMHDVVFKTDEEGSEAAAVTAVGLVMCSYIPPAPTIDVKFDRSFVFALQDIATGAIIFAGAVNKPNDDMKPVEKPTDTSQFQLGARLDKPPRAAKL